MPEHKKQHYLPRVYLSQWAGPSGKVWRHDGAGCQVVPFRSQCQKPYFYSKAEAEEAEHEMQTYETQWAAALEALATGRRPFERGVDALKLCMHFAARTRYFEHQGPSEGLTGYRAALCALMVSYSPETWGEAVTRRGGDRELNVDTLRGMKADFPVALEVMEAAAPLVTSDNPCIMVGDDGESWGFVLPMTPRFLLLATNPSRMCAVGGRVSSTLVQRLNGLQAGNRVSNLYSWREIHPDSVVVPSKGRGVTIAGKSPGKVPWRVDGTMLEPEWLAGLVRFSRPRRRQRT